MEIECPYCNKVFDFKPSEPVKSYNLNTEAVGRNEKEYVTQCTYCNKLVIACSKQREFDLAELPTSDKPSDGDDGKRVIKGKKPSNPELLDFWIKYAQTIVSSQLWPWIAADLIATCASKLCSGIVAHL